MAPVAPAVSSRDLTIVQITALRLVAQRLVGSDLGTPWAVAAHLLASQGQDYAGAKWSLASRSPGATDADVEAAFRDGEIVRSWPLRGTLHVTAAEDLPWLLETLAPRVIAATARRRADLALTDRQLGKARTIAEKALAGNLALGRDELLARFDADGVSTEGQRGYHILAYLGQTRTLCFGPIEGKHQTFVLLDEWIEKPRKLGREEALGELATRYFTSHGPATMADFCGWAGLTVKDAKLGLSCGLLAKRLVERTCDGVPCWLGSDVEDRRATLEKALKTSVLALAGFDEYVLGYKDRDAFLDPAHANAICPGSNGIFFPTLVRGGQIVGTWRRTTKTKETIAEMTPFGDAPKMLTAGFARAMEAYGAFLETAVRVVSAAAAKRA